MSSTTGNATIRSVISLWRSAITKSIYSLPSVEDVQTRFDPPALPCRKGVIQQAKRVSVSIPGHCRRMSSLVIGGIKPVTFLVTGCSIKLRGSLPLGYNTRMTRRITLAVHHPRSRRERGQIAFLFLRAGRSSLRGLDAPVWSTNHPELFKDFYFFPRRFWWITISTTYRRRH